MASLIQGPYVGTGVSNNDQDVSIETTRTKTNGTHRPDVNMKDMLKGLVVVGFMIMAVFWINLSHIYGLFQNQGAYVKRARVALADFDGGDFGNALRTAAASNNGSYGFPTYINVDITRTTPDQIRHQVFDGKYWAAIIVEPGASIRFEEALNGTVSSYNASDVYTYYLLTARYYALYAGGIQSSTITTASAAAGIFSSQYASRRLASGDFANSTAAASALAVPARAVEYSAGPLEFSNLNNKALLNTIGAVMPILMQFFFIMAWNGICNGMHLYAAYNLRTHVLARVFWSIFWPLLSSLCSAGWTFAFRGSYHLDAKMFFAFWAVTWVYSMISFDMLDIITGFVPMAFVPFLMVSWVIFNVAASLGDPTILNHWFRINYFFPALHWYQTFITIISQGGVNRLHYTLPVLAGWLVVLKVLSPFATRHRVGKAKHVFQYFSDKNALDAPH